MWIEDLALDDFGCFDHARVEGLRNGVNVVAGPQRAGKTTFMQALRHLGYKIPRDGSVPPASNEYSLGAVATFEGDDYRIDVSGHGAPTVAPVADDPERSVEELYAELRRAQYHQLYTISLDELEQTPRSLDDDVDLSEVLLGGAFGDVVKLPTIRDEFGNAAANIGGKYARSSYELKGPIGRIEDGVEERDAATDQVDEYEHVRETIEDRSERLDEIEAEIEDLSQESRLLNTIAAQYDDVRELQRCERKLADVDEAALDAFPMDRVDIVKNRTTTYRQAREEATEEYDAFATTVDAADTDAYLDRLRSFSADVRRHAAELSGLRERHTQLVDGRADLDRTWAALEREATELNADWSGDLDAVRRVETDAFARDDVQQITSAYADARRTREQAESDREAARDRISSLESQLEAARRDRTESGGVPTGIAIGGAALALGLGVGAGVLGGPIAGVVVTFLVLLGTGTVVFRQTGTPDDTATAVQKLEADLRSERAEAERYESMVTAAEEDLEAARGEFADLCTTLGLTPEMEPQSIASFHATVRDLESNVRDAERREATLEADAEHLREDLTEVAETLVAIDALGDVPESPIDEAERLFVTLERVAEHAERARTVSTVRRDVTDARADLVAELSAWSEAPQLETADAEELNATAREFLDHADTVAELQERCDRRDHLESRLRAVFEQGGVAKALSNLTDGSEIATDGGGLSDDGSTLDHVVTVIGEYGDRAGIETRLEKNEDRLEDLEAKQDELTDERAELQNRLDDLRSSDDVHEAHETIQAGRRELRPLAEEYATNRIAEYFLDELYDRYIDRTTGPLLEEASRVFGRITDGAYAGIETQDELDDLDFVALLDGGAPQVPDELSRATVEQLFLAIRIARIRQESQPLPVILDDSFTNFDPQHRTRTLQVIDELAGSNQVFLLTCHPDVVETAASASSDAAYWHLRDGSFDRLPSADDAASRLRPDDGDA